MLLFRGPDCSGRLRLIVNTVNYSLGILSKAVVSLPFVANESGERSQPYRFEFTSLITSICRKAKPAVAVPKRDLNLRQQKM